MIAALVLAGVLVALVLISGTDEEPAGNEPESSFITRLAALDARALALARLGTERTTRTEVKLYADQTIRSLTRELEELDLVHDLIYGEPPETRGKVDPPALRGGDFDRAFIDALIAAHEEAIKVAQQEIERDEDPDLVELARKAVSARTPQVTSMKRFRSDALAAPRTG